MTESERIKKLKVRVKMLEEALEKYSKHNSQCYFLDHQEIGIKACDCNARTAQLALNFPEIQSALNAQGERDFTPEEALAEAKKRWGADGWISMFSENEDGSMTYEVGYGSDSEDGREVTFMGAGTSFHAAFAQADKAAKEEGK